MATEYNLGRVVGAGFPVGGVEGETIIKNSDQNFDARWGHYTLQEADPTVPAWAKQPAKPAYTAAEVGAAKPAIQANTTLSTTWTSGAQSISNANILANSPGDIYIRNTASAAQFKAFNDAQLQVTAQAAGSVTVTARGIVPTISIPISLEIRS